MFVLRRFTAPADDSGSDGEGEGGAEGEGGDAAMEVEDDSLHTFEGHSGDSHSQSINLSSFDDHASRADRTRAQFHSWLPPVYNLITTAL